MNTTYLIDLENVNSAGLDGARSLDKTDELVIFYSEKADTLKIHVITQLLGTEASIKFYKCKNGIMNAMDFDIVSVLGILFTEERKFVIISKDKGFDVVISRYRTFGKHNVFKQSVIGFRHDALEIEKPEELSPDENILAEPDVVPVSEPEPQPEETVAEPEISEPEATAQETEIKDAFDDLFEGLFGVTEEESPAAEAAPEEQPEPEPEPTEPSVQPEAVEEEPAEEPKTAPVKKTRKKKTPASASAPAEMSRVQKGQVNKFLNNIMGAKHAQPMTKDELKLVRETAEASKTKNAFYNALRKKLGNEKGIALYNKVKDEYDEIAQFITNLKKK